MTIKYKRGFPERERGKFRIRMSSTHPGLEHSPKGRAWKKGYRMPPRLLKEAIDYYNGREEDVYDVLLQLETTALLCPGIWRVEIVVRAIRDPWYEDPEFPSDGYIMGLLIPEDEKLPMPYLRLLAFQWTKWLHRPWHPAQGRPYVIKMID